MTPREDQVTHFVTFRNSFEAASEAYLKQGVDAVEDLQGPDFRKTVVANRQLASDVNVAK